MGHFNLGEHVIVSPGLITIPLYYILGLKYLTISYCNCTNDFFLAQQDACKYLLISWTLFHLRNNRKTADVNYVLYYSYRLYFLMTI